MFIAVVGISAGPSFVQGLKEVGPMLFIIGALATSLPLLLGLILARYVFKFPPSLWDARQEPVLPLLHWVPYKKQ